MKKSILFLFFALINLSIFSQNEGNFYEKQNLVKASRFLGTPASWHHLINFMNVSENPNNIYDSIGNPDYCQVGGYYMQRGSMIYYSEDGINTIVTDSLVFDSLYTDNRQLASDPYWRNDKSSYASISYANSNFKPMAYTPTVSVSGYSFSAGGNLLALPNPTLGLGFNPLSQIIFSDSLISVNSKITARLPILRFTDTTSSINVKISARLPITRFTDSIASMNAKISARVPSARILTINGTALNLTSDRTWSLTTAVIGEQTNLYYTNARARAAISVTTGLSYDNSTGIITNSLPDRTVTIVCTNTNVITITGTYPNFTVSPVARTTNTVTRSLVTSTAATGYSISATQDYNVSYSIYAQVTSALIGTNTADVYLETSPNNSTWTTISRSGISLAGVVSTCGNTQTVSGFVPVGYYVRLRTAATGANAGVAVFTYQNGQENSY